MQGSDSEQNKEGKREESDSEDSDSDSDTSSTSTVSFTKEEVKDRSKMTPQQRRVYWLKKVDKEKVKKTYPCKFKGCGKTFKDKR